MTRHAFVAAGYSDVDAAARASLIGEAEQAFRRQAGRAPDWRWFVPGRIEVFGKHTDYAGGRSLVCAVPRGFAVVAAARDDDVVSVVDVAVSERAVVDAGSTGAHDGWASYVAVVARRLRHNFPGARLGVDLAFVSDLPRSAGLSSSSALVVAVSSALIRRGRLEERPEWRSAISSDHQLAWYLGCVENGLDFPRLPGTAGVGTLGGSEDHTAILTCRPGHLSENRYAPVVHLDDVRMPAEWTFVVATSGVRADKTGAALERYNRLSRATSVLLSLWNAAQAEPASTLASALHRAGGPEAWASFIDRANHIEFSRADLTRRLSHFVREDARVAAAARAIAASEAVSVATLAADSQREADELLGNQIPETRVLVEEALGAGAWAASSFGAGFGGSVWALTSRDRAAHIGREWVARYRARCLHVSGVEWFVSPPGPPRVEV